ncbi:TRAF-like signal transducer, putative [Paecilomyces variotii No. 5]|uniref:TRAF-like signal transducer, putative n=1 Tax=Byssochlamys spectabilis (strain No. 5 / NBRC 109023) TaxID=1356009 RepID=V5FT15_BYSSN|nr:TRAF-like signal transducer, putative [Paecilomyces variotii No. 5]
MTTSLLDLLGSMGSDRSMDELVDLRALEYVSSYDAHLMCPICHCPFIRPVRLQCDHVFCQTCLNSAMNAIDVSPEDFTCPTCRAPTKDIFMNVPRLLINMCDDILVKCPYSEGGCSEIVPRGHVQSHVDKYCEYKLVECPSLTCDKKTRKKNMSPDHRCMHTIHRCDQCEEGVMEQDLEEHVSELCPSLRTNCPDCHASIFRNALQEHIDSCPEAIHPCAAAKYGCPVKLKRADLGVHEQSCPLITMGPYFEAQNSRMDSMDMTIKHLKQRNEILEDGIANIQSTLVEATRAPRETRTRSSARERSGSPSSQEIPSSTAVDRSSNLSSSTATTYLLSLHESLRDEVSQLSHAITDLDARASMAIMNESLRIKEDMAHTNAALNSVLWYTTSELRDFMASPSAQLYVESLASAEIVPLVSYETIYGYGHWFGVSPLLSRTFTQLFWVYFPAPMTQAQQAEVSNLRGIRPPVMGFSIPQSQLRQTHLPVQLWATKTEYLHGREAQLMLWPHFWRDAEKAEWRLRRYPAFGSPMERFIEDLEKVDPMEWKEELYQFKRLPRLPFSP